MRPRSTSSHRLHRITAGLLAIGLIAGISFSDSSAGAQSVESLRAQAARLSKALNELEQRSSELNEQYLVGQEKLDELQAERQSNVVAVDGAQRRVDSTRSEAADYLVEAYIGAGAHDTVTLGSSDPNEAVNSQVMLEVLRGDRQLMADDISASKQDLEARSAELERSAKELAAEQDRQREVVSELEASTARHDELLNSTNADLNAAVAAERARQEAEAAARAEAAAQAQASRLAAAAQTRATQVSPPRAVATSGSTTRATAPAPSRSAASSAAPAPAPAPIPVSAPNGRGGAAIAAAMAHLGLPYRWGGTSPSTGFDCSGLTGYAWRQAGVSLPRTSGAQKAATQRISRDQLQPGDLVFSGNPVYHVGMYIGGGQMIHSPHTGDVVKISSMFADSYGRVR